VPAASLKRLRWPALLCGTVFVLCLLLTAFTMKPAAQNRVLLSSSVLQISEYSAFNDNVPDTQGNPQDDTVGWVELHLLGPDQSLDGWALTLDKASFALSGTLTANQYTVIFLTPDTGLALSPAGGQLLGLRDPQGSEVESVRTLGLAAGQSAARTDSIFAVSDTISPGYPNTKAGIAAYSGLHTAPQTNLLISEVMADNTVTLADGSGAYADYIEVFNNTTAAMNIAGYGLTNDAAKPFKYSFPAGTVLQPGERTVVFAVGTPPAGPASGTLVADEASFKINRRADTLYLTDTTGVIIDSVSVSNLGADTALIRQADYTFAPTAWPTPGFPHTPDGAEAFAVQRDKQITSPVLVNEILCRNTQYGVALAGHYYGLIELYNRSDQPVDLTGWSLTDDAAQPGKCPLSGAIAAGGYLVVYATGGTVLRNSPYIQAPFKLTADAGSVLLIGPDGAVADGVSFGSYIPADMSKGRMAAGGFGFFSTPTIGAANGDGVRLLPNMG